ncbi:hypothetical protein [Desulfitobacterium hafniense]|uniref:Uncharacterized protein n=3 Tax=Desulfitobacterium hafniense TaxID=49338 RepID=Q24QR0_DESHY|nr:hypothetical protein [Desulfitobacterium hafniense]EHL06718.1 hypothetical protein HMPREF0322_02561 [Desulfitobacterium hafniense DP7]KTE89396.1 hypothetical protein AT727_13440 [Desulfitobacterium hafniense]BAE85632.1 hypothetical protein DSY3843 [Desulfitobacterium hafniense Y51]CDX04030.1 Hypothetical protein DPCES_4144 [Desulfitobacterium hafniense]
MMEKKYFGGWEVDFEDKTRLRFFLLVHGTDKKGFDFFKKVQSALEFQISGNRLHQAFVCSREGKTRIAENIDLPIAGWEEHPVFYLTKQKKGPHKLGGDKPAGLVLPASEDMRTPFQYLGTIDGSDPHFQWLGVPKLNIVYPLYECNFGIFLDYSDPQQPQILNPETFSDAWYTGEIPKGIQFTEVHFESKDHTERLTAAQFEESDDYLICGVPLWYQMPEVPCCPKTGDVMRFVCTINSDDSIKVVNRENRAIPDDYLIFGDHGNLFVFYHPESKVLHLNAQW